MTVSGPQREELDRILDRYMAERGLKSTRQRSLIIDTFFGSERPPLGRRAVGAGAQARRRGSRSPPCTGR